MRRLLLFIVIILQVLTAFGQDLMSVNAFGGSGDNQVVKSVIDNQNNVYIVGIFSGTVTAGGLNYTSYGTGSDTYISKYDQNGNLLWFKQIGSNNANDVIDAITLSNDGGTIYVAGGFYGSPCTFGDGKSLTKFEAGTTTCDAFLISINTASGLVIDAKRIAYGNGNQRPQAVRIDKNSNIVIIGFVAGDLNKTYFSSSDSITCSGVQNYFILQLNTTFNVNWFKHFIGNDVNNKLYSLDVDDNGYYIAGTNKNTLNLVLKTLISNSSSQDMFLFKTDFDGNGQWIRSIKGSGNDVSVYATCDQLGHVYISGYYASTDLKVDSTEELGVVIQSKETISNRGSNDIFFAKYDTDGNLKWHDNAGSTGDDRLTRLATNGQYIVIAGQYSGNMTFGNIPVNLPAGNGTDAFGVVHDANDNPMYAVRAGGNLTDIAQTCVIDNQGRYIFIGQFYSGTMDFGGGNTLTNPTTTTRDVFIAKYDKASIGKSKTDITCPGAANGSVVATAQGAWFGDVTVVWTKKGEPAFNRTTLSINGLGPGTYYCTMKDALNYEKTDSVTFSDPASIGVAINSQTNVSCYNGSNGSIFITASGGTAPYTYEWNTTGGGGQCGSCEDQNGILRAGSYTVKVTDSKGCNYTTAPVTITQPAAISISNVTVTNVSSNGANDGAISTTVSGGTSPYTYNWSPGGYATEDITGLAGNTYSLSVSDANSCTRDSSIFVYEPGVLNVSYTKTDVSCNAGTNGSIDLTINGQFPPFTISWTKNGSPFSDPDPSDGDSLLVGLGAGTYVATVKDSDSPQQSRNVSIVITQPAAALSATPTPTHIPCYGQNNGQIDLLVSGGTSPYTYAWTKSGSPVGTTEDLAGLSPGTYNVTVTDSKACTFNTSQVINEPTALVISNPVVTNVSCYGSTTYDGKICISPSGGTPAYTVSWSYNSATTNCIDKLRQGTYSVTLKDSKNCQVSAEYNVTAPAAFSYNFTPTHVSCYGGADGALSVSVSGGNLPVASYSWSTGEGTQSISGKDTGRYVVNIVDSKGCTGSANYTLTQPDSISILLSTLQKISCNGLSDGYIETSVSGGSTPYNSQTWFRSASVVGSGKDIFGIGAGTYRLRITDKNNCVEEDTFVLADPPALVPSEVTASHVNNSCYGQSLGVIELSATGGYGSYEYTINGTSWQSSPTFNGLAAATYSPNVRDALYPTCKGTALSSVVSQPADITFTTSVDSVNCFGGSDGSVTMTASGGNGSYTYRITQGDSTNTGGTFRNLPVGTYTISVTDGLGCGPKTSGNLMVAQPAVLTITPGTVSMVSCNGASDGSIQLAVSGGTLPYSFAWSPNGSTTRDLSGLAAGIYVLTVTDKNACTKQFQDTITQPAALSLSEVTSSHVNNTCYGESQGVIVLSAAGGYGSYEYSLDGTNWQSSASFANLAAADYTAQLRDAQHVSCVWSGSLIIPVTQPQDIVLGTASIDSTLCAGSSDGSISISATGGNGSYTFTLTPGNTSNSTGSFSNLSAGSYQISVLDGLSCGPKSVSNLIVPEPLPISITAGTVQMVSCYGLSDGSIQPNVIGGKLPYAYSWNPGGSSSKDISSLSAGIYELTVTDKNNCSGIFRDTITQPDSLHMTELLANHLDNPCSGNSKGAFTLVGTGGSGVYQYSLDGTNWQDSPLFALLPSANYTTRMRDKLVPACVWQGSLTIPITEPQPIKISSFDTTHTVFNQSTGTITLSASGGASPYTYRIIPSGPSNSNGQFTSLAFGNYSILITDANSCTKDTGNIEIGNVGLIDFSGKALQVYPNPFRSSFTLRIERSESARYTAELVNLLGQTVLIRNIDVQNGSRLEEEFDLSSHPNGLYLLKVRYGDQVKVMEVIKNSNR